MRIEGPQIPMGSQPGGQQVSASDAQSIEQINNSIEQLTQIQNLASKAQALGASSPKSDDPLQSAFSSYITSVISYLKSKGVPASLLSYFTTQLSSITVGTPKAYEQMTALMHQICLVGEQADPNFAKEVGSVFTPGVKAASSALQTLQGQLQALEQQMGPQAKYFQDILNLQTFLLNFPSSCSTEQDLQQIWSTLQDLVGGVNDPTWQPVVKAALSALSNIPQFTEALGTYLFMNQFATNANQGAFSSVDGPLKAACNQQIQSFIQTNIPFLQAIADKMQWWEGNYQKSGAPYLKTGPAMAPPWQSGTQSANLAYNWKETLLNTFQAIPSTSISSALSALDQALPLTPNWTAISVVLAPFQEAEALNSSFAAAAKGDLATAFPEGPTPQSQAPYPSALNSNLSACVAALIKILLEDQSNPAFAGIAPLLPSFIQENAGPPFPANILDNLTQLSSAIQAIAPFTAAQKQTIQKLFTSLDNQIASLQKNAQSAAAQEAQNKQSMPPLEKIFQEIAAFLQTDPKSHSRGDWNTFASYYYQMITMVMKLPTSSPLYQQAVSLISSLNTFTNGDPSTCLGMLIFNYMAASGMSGDAIVDWTNTAGPATSSQTPLAKALFNVLDTIYQSARGTNPYTQSDLENELLPSTISDLSNNIVTVREQYSIFDWQSNFALYGNYENQIGDANAQIKQLQDFENSLKSVFPGV